MEQTQLPDVGAEFALTHPKENQRQEEERVEEGREDKRSKRRKTEVRRHPWAKPGKQETQKTYRRLASAMGHTVPSATSCSQSLLIQTPNPLRTISPSHISTLIHMTFESISI